MCGHFQRTDDFRGMSISLGGGNFNYGKLSFPCVDLRAWLVINVELKAG